MRFYTYARLYVAAILTLCDPPLQCAASGAHLANVFRDFIVQIAV
jgi:hypothetical protein